LKAIALFSGGLDSALAIKIIQEQNIEVEGVYIDIGFESNKDKNIHLQKLADELDIKLTIINTQKDYIENILFNPVYGYGKNFNPCIDCHSHMIKVAKEYMEKVDAKFIISGEVLNQRPMSQRRVALNLVNKLSNANNLVLRPLSAKLLAPTIPEINKWINREKLFAISGRDRKIQLELVKKYNLENFKNPSGGCLLTDINFSKRLKDFSKYLPFGVNEIDILKVGRHFNIDGLKIIISRNEKENKILKEYKGNLFYKIYPINFLGPIGLIQKEANKNIKEFATNILISYTKTNKGEVKIEDEIFMAKKLDKTLLKNFLI